MGRQRKLRKKENTTPTNCLKEQEQLNKRIVKKRMGMRMGWQVMQMRINTDFFNKVKDFGFDTTYECFNCGNCTAICPISSNEEQFPPKIHQVRPVGSGG